MVKGPPAGWAATLEATRGPHLPSSRRRGAGDWTGAVRPETGPAPQPDRLGGPKPESVRNDPDDTARTSSGLGPPAAPFPPPRRAAAGRRRRAAADSAGRVPPARFIVGLAPPGDLRAHWGRSPAARLLLAA